MAQRNIYALNLTRRCRETMKVTLEGEDGADLVVEVMEPNKRIVDEMDAFSQRWSDATEDAEKAEGISESLWALVAHILTHNVEGREFDEQWVAENILVNECWGVLTMYQSFIAQVKVSAAKK